MSDTVSYTASQIDEMLAKGDLERIGMGSRRACYRLPCGDLCVKCYRSDAEIAEGKHPGRERSRPLRKSTIREIRKCRFDERRNTCCQEFRYWESLRRRLPADLIAAFPSTMQLMLLPSRGWCVVEELILNADGSAPASVHSTLLARPSADQAKVEAALRAFANRLAECSVRLYDPHNVMVRRALDGSFELRIADFEPGTRTLLPLSEAIPFLVRMKVRRRMDRFLSFVARYRKRTYGASYVDTKPLHVVRNRAGRMLVAWTDDFTRADPELAANVIPVPPAEAAAYVETPGGETFLEFASAMARGECAWMFYPSKLDDVRTVFFIEDGRLFVKKSVPRRARRLAAQKFVQREIPPLPIFKGRSVADMVAEKARLLDYGGVESTLDMFFTEMEKAYPPISEGVMPPCTFDAIPQNCIVSADGRYNFFDLEYDMRGGVPLSYLIFRAVCTTVVRMEKELHMGYDYWRTIRALAERRGVAVDKDECLRINAAAKRFNTQGVRRMLTNIWLSLLPVRAWRTRFCWWSTVPARKEVPHGG